MLFHGQRGATASQKDNHSESPVLRGGVLTAALGGLTAEQAVEDGDHDRDDIDYDSEASWVSADDSSDYSLFGDDDMG